MIPITRSVNFCRIAVLLMVFLVLAPNALAISGRVVRGIVAEPDGTPVQNAVVTVYAHPETSKCSANLSACCVCMTPKSNYYSYTYEKGDYAIITSNMVFGADCPILQARKGDVCDGWIQGDDMLWVSAAVDGNIYTSKYSAGLNFNSYYIEKPVFADEVNITVPYSKANPTDWGLYILTSLITLVIIAMYIKSEDDDEKKPKNTK